MRVDVHKLCCDYRNYIECMGYLPPDDAMYDVRKAYCEYIYCDIECLEKTEEKQNEVSEG